MAPPSEPPPSLKTSISQFSREVDDFNPAVAQRAGVHVAHPGHPRLEDNPELQCGWCRHDSPAGLVELFAEPNV